MAKVTVKYTSVDGKVHYWQCVESRLQHILDICEQKQLQVIDWYYQ